MSEESDNQRENNLKPWLWKKGQSGNILGRPKGKTMKEYAKQYLERMTDDERDEWLEGLPKEVIWQMGEGKAEAKTDITPDGALNAVLVKFLDAKDNRDTN